MTRWGCDVFIMYKEIQKIYLIRNVFMKCSYTEFTDRFVCVQSMTPICSTRFAVCSSATFFLNVFRLKPFSFQPFCTKMAVVNFNI